MIGKVTAIILEKSESHEEVIVSVASKQTRSSNILWQSFVGIFLGALGGVLLVWYILPFSPTKTIIHKKKKAPIGFSDTTTDKELYVQALHEIEQNKLGKVFQYIKEKRPFFLMRPHLMWQLGERYLRSGYSQKAIPYYMKLLKTQQLLWSKKRLLYRIAHSYWNAHKKRKARIYLWRSIKAKFPRGRRGWYWKHIERQEAAAALLFYGQIPKSKNKYQIYMRLWLNFSDSPYAVKGEKAWWRLLKKRHFRFSSKEYSKIFKAIKFYMTIFAYPKKAKILLNHLKKKKLSSKYKKRWIKLQSQWYLRWGRRKATQKTLSQLFRLQRKKHHPSIKYKIAEIELKKGRVKAFWRAVRKIKKHRRYWRSRGAFLLARWHLKRRKFRKAKSYYKIAWKLRKNKYFRAKLYLDLGILALMQHRRSRARRYFRQAIKSRRKASMKYSYWLARSEESTKAHKKALRRYYRIYRKAGFSLYGFLSAWRLALHHKIKPYKLASSSNPKFQWNIPNRSGQKWKRLRLLAQYGSKELYLLELERIALLYKHPPIGLLLKISQLSHKLKLFHIGIKWLRQDIARYIYKGKAPTQTLLLNTYPQPSSFWSAISKTSKKFRLDSRLVAAMIFHQSYFQRTFRRGRYIGLMALNPKWSSSINDKLQKNLTIGCKRLHYFSKKWGSTAWGIAAYLHPSPYKIKRIARTFRRTPEDIQYFFLPAQTKRIIQTYKLYQFLYITK